MSQAQITFVKAARKEYDCEKCKTHIGKGDPYKHFTVGFRSHHKHVRCDQATCHPRRSELESSKRSSIYAAQESATDTINVGPVDGDMAPDDYIGFIRGEIESVVEAIREVGDEYREASTDDMGNVFSPQSEEAADQCDSAADELENWEPTDSNPEGCGDHDGTAYEGATRDQPCSACEGILTDWIEQTRDEATEAIDNVEV